MVSPCLRLFAPVNGSNNPSIDMFTKFISFQSAVLVLAGLLTVTGINARAASAIVVAGQAVTLSTTVDGTAPFTYKWYKDGTVITGAVASNYLISSFQTISAGVYSAVISNSAGSTTSDNATITLASAPVMTTQPASQTVTAGGPVTFTVLASGMPSPTYQWLKNGVGLSGATGAAYAIAGAVAGDAGTYSVVATNSAGAITSNGAVLTVSAANTAPTITTIANQTTVPGTAVGPISFTVGDSQTAAGSLIVTGTSSNTTLVPAGNIVFGGSGANRTVTLTPAAGQAGTATITLTVTDGVGLTTSIRFTLTVSASTRVRPVIVNGYGSHGVSPGPFASATISNVVPSGTNRLLIVTLDLWQGSTAGVTFGGVPLTQFATGDWAGGGKLETWYLVNPATTSGNVAITFTSGTISAYDAQAFTLSGVDQATPFGTPSAMYGVNGSLALSPASSTTDLVLFNVVGNGQVAPAGTGLAVARLESGSASNTLFTAPGGAGSTSTTITYPYSLAGVGFAVHAVAGGTNTPPTISAVGSQTTTTGMAVGPLSFTVGDAETAVASLRMSGTSTNTTLVPTANIVFGGSGASRTVIVTPAAGLTGTVTISVTVSDGTLTATSTFLLTVNTPLSAPVFTTQPVSKTVTTGSAVTFTSVASGLPAPTYQWRKNGTAISGATGATYTIASVAASDAGTYSVVATNSVGSATSTGAVLTVNSMPVVTTQPVSQTVIAGANVTFSVAASGTPTPTYQWRKNAVNLSGATAATYTITNATTSSAGTYTVLATNSVGSVTSTGAVLTVNAANTAPTLTAMANQTTVSGTAVGPIGFTVGDAQTAAASLIVTGTSSNATLVPNGNIVFGGSGANRTVTLTPAAGQTGTSTITVTVSDGALTASTAFVLSVSAPAGTTQTVTNAAALTIPDSGAATPYPSTVTVAGLGGTISAVTLRLNGFSHTWASDVNVLLVSPTGQKILVMSNAGTTTTNATLTFSDTAAGALPRTGVLVTGTYQPTSYGTLTSAFPAPAPAGPYATRLAALTGQAANGVWSLYVMDGWPHDQGTIAGGWSLTVTTSPLANWSDFNGDGSADILWQNGTTGGCSVWFMAGTALSGSASLGAMPLGMKIGGTGDLNGDGRPDILWQNVATGECSVWLMSGITVSSTVSLGTVSAGWQMRGTGDFNGDGRSDILWQNSVTGECSVWLMAGTTVSSIVSLGKMSTDLMITGTGDFNQDGQSDILWQNTATGEYGIWLMSGVTIDSNVSLGTVSLDWQMIGAGDFNGDGQSDLLWQNLLTGENSVWLMRGTTVSSKVALGTLSLDWIMRN